MIKRLLSKYVVYFGLLLVFITFTILLHGQGFATKSNFFNIIVQAAPITIMAVFSVFVLSAQEIDLSLGATVAISGLVAGLLLQHNVPFALASLIALLASVLVGVVNSFFVTIVRVPSFLTTLAFLGVVTGTARWITNLKTLSVSDSNFIAFFGGGSLFGLPSLIIWSVIVVIFGHVLLAHTRFGAWVLAVGDNPYAAASQGIRVKAIKSAVLIMGSFGAGLAGLLYAGRLQSATYTMGSSDTLTVIAAAVIGGTSLFGGKGSVPGALAGSLLLAMLTNGLLLAGFSVTQQIIVQGLVLLVAMTISIRSKSGD